jgi:surface protein
MSLGGSAVGLSFGDLYYYNGSAVTVLNVNINPSSWTHVAINATPTGLQISLNGGASVNTSASVPSNSLNEIGTLDGTSLGQVVFDEIGFLIGSNGTTQNITDLYNSGNGESFTTVMGANNLNLHLNESGTDTIAIDSGGSGNDGTLNNFPTSGMWIPHTSIPFIMTVDTTQAGSASDTFVLPFRSIGSYNCVIDWGDSSSSTITSYNDAALTHVYSTPGTYQISISGSFGGLFFVNTGDKLKLSSIDQWGNNIYQSFDGAFWGCSNMVGTFTDYPNLGTISNLNYMFENCTSFNSNLISWDTSNVTTMANMFKGSAAFNGDISSWDVSNVTSFTRMFQSASAFNSDISSWDVSSVINMSITFYGATAFDKDLGSWNVSSVTNFTDFMTLKTPSTFSASNLDAIYNGWDSRAVQTPIVITFGSAKHTAASSTARASLVSKGWTITDGGI